MNHSPVPQGYDPTTWGSTAKLTAQQVLALDMLLQPAEERESMQMIALACNVQEVTLRKWVEEDSAFLLEWRRRIGRRFAQPSRLQDAVKALEDVLLSPATTGRDKIAAAKTMVEYYDRFAQISQDDGEQPLPNDLKDLTALEKRISAAKQVVERGNNPS